MYRYAGVFTGVVYRSARVSKGVVYRSTRVSKGVVYRCAAYIKNVPLARAGYRDAVRDRHSLCTTCTRVHAVRRVLALNLPSLSASTHALDLHSCCTGVY